MILILKKLLYILLAQVFLEQYLSKVAEYNHIQKKIIKLESHTVGLVFLSVESSFWKDPINTRSFFRYQKVQQVYQKVLSHERCQRRHSLSKYSLNLLNLL
jgi:hypothetical protein